jgi:hypothetical protein
MAIGRPKSELILSENERIQLCSLAGSRSLPHAIVARANVVLWSAEGMANSDIAIRLGWTNATVGNGGVVSWNGVFPGCTTNSAPAGLAPSRMRRSQSC